MTTPAAPEHTHPNVADTPCPGCGNKTLAIEMRLTASPVGTFSLAGVGMKVTAATKPWLVCTNCGIEAEGKSA